MDSDAVGWAPTTTWNHQLSPWDRSKMCWCILHDLAAVTGMQPFAARPDLCGYQIRRMRLTALLVNLFAAVFDD